ncbi:hypothetical protein PVK06_042273 [Gossypium arboreum]|uniref:Retrotransposon gag domain-containing protein n=1 Tax=Gossypium arboreum TaxID=29729 RepID=A0ABR0MKC5_GOSAR|nr:hypothetical protein PVK06_042273 [Gossypium arboreum]
MLSWHTTSGPRQPDPFAADTGAKQSRLWHELHSLKKGNMSIKTYIAQIKSLCALLETLGSRISDEERIEIILARLSRQNRAIQKISFHANLVEPALSHVVESSARGGRSSPRGRGITFRPRIQCQICNRFGHLAQRCYYRYHRNSDAPLSTPPIQSQEGPTVSHGCRSAISPPVGEMGVPDGGNVGDDWVFLHVKTPRVSYYSNVGQN